MSIEIGLLITIITLIVAVLGYQLNREKQQFDKQRFNAADAQNEARIQAQLEHIGKGVDEIRIDLKANEKQMVALGERVTRVEESSKQAHKRIDKIEGNE